MIFRLFVFLLASLTSTIALIHLIDATNGLDIVHTEVDEIPVTIFRPENGTKLPTVVIAHGFAGSQQLMQPFALTLAHNGYLAMTFDFPGHGRNPNPLHGGLTDTDRLEAQLGDALGKVVQFAGKLPNSDGKIALLGHSMATDMVVRYAQAHPDILATVAVSPFAPTITATTPRDLDIIVGALEPAMLKDAAFAALRLATGGPDQARTTYGNMDNGTARRVSLSGGVEHISVLYSAQTLREALNWLDAAFHHESDGELDLPGADFALLFGSLIALAWPLSTLLRPLAATRLGASLRWGTFLVIAIVPALLTPLILWKLPTDFLPLLLGDYLAVHFAVYGALSWALLRLLRQPWPARPTRWGPLLGTAAVVAVYNVVAIGGPIDNFITSFRPIPFRLPLIAAVFIGALPYFAADEWITRGAGAPRGAYALTKLCFLVSLVIAVVLNPERLFFLIIITPVMLIFFLVYGLFSRWTYRATHQPFAGALANAFTFAWAIAVTFPTIAS